MKSKTYVATVLGFKVEAAIFLAGVWWGRERGIVYFVCFTALCMERKWSLVSHIDKSKFTQNFSSIHMPMENREMSISSKKHSGIE